MIRAKFKVSCIEHHDWGGRVVHLDAQYDESIPEDRRFAVATPSGSMTMQVDNPEVLKELELGRKFYLDLIPIDEAGGQAGDDCAGQ